MMLRKELQELRGFAKQYADVEICVWPVYHLPEEVNIEVYINYSSLGTFVTSASVRKLIKERAHRYVHPKPKDGTSRG